MNYNKLKAKIILKNLKVSDFLEKAKIDRTRYYRVLRGEDEFNREEIKNIIDTLGLEKEEAMDIFFAETVS